MSAPNSASYANHPLLSKSRGLNGLDLRMLDHMDRRGGFFIEAGANDGLNQNNTYILEHAFGWRGMLIEPMPVLAER